MDQSALNLAHQYGRKAASYYRKRRFDEAAEQHKKAADMLDIALARIENPRSLESLGTQRRYHATQVLVALARKEQYEYLKQAMEIEKNTATMLNKIGEKQEGDMKLKLFNMLSTAESLINELASRKNADDSDKSKVENNAMHALEELQRGPSPSDAKDSFTIIKELQDLIINVHSLVINIADQLDESNAKKELLVNEIERLKSKQGTTVKTTPVISEKTKKIAIPNTAKMTETIIRPEAITRPETTVLNNELVNVNQYEPPKNICQLANFTELEIPERPPLPPLPPLEMPDIDYSMFISSTSLVPIPKRLLRNVNTDKITPNSTTSGETNTTKADESVVSEKQIVGDHGESDSAVRESGECAKAKDGDESQS